MAAQKQPREFGSTESGRYEKERWEGGASSVLSKIAPAELAGGLPDYREMFGGLAELTVTYPYNLSQPPASDPPVNTWELFSNVVEKDILYSNAVTTGAVLVSVKNRQKLQSFFNDPPDFVIFDDFENDGTATNAVDLYNLFAKGFKSVPIFAPIIRHIQTVNNQWTIPAARTNVGRIISSASFRATESVPSDIYFQLPNDVSGDSAYAYGWLKKEPTTRTAALQKTQLEQEWNYGLWPILLYLSPI